MNKIIDETEPDLGLLLTLRRHIMNGNEVEALIIAKALAEDMIGKQYPELLKTDSMLYHEVLRISVPMMIERAKSVLLGSNKLVS